MNIFIPKNGNSKRFVPGYNIALGKTYHTASDYVSDMKKRGFEPYDESFNQKEPEVRYKPSKKAHEIAEYIKRNTRKDGKVQLSTKVMNEIGDYLPGNPKNQQNVTQLNTKSGGFSNDQDNGSIKRVSKSKR